MDSTLKDKFFGRVTKAGKVVKTRVLVSDIKDERTRRMLERWVDDDGKVEAILAMTASIAWKVIDSGDAQPFEALCRMTGQHAGTSNRELLRRAENKVKPMTIEFRQKAVGG